LALQFLTLFYFILFFSERSGTEEEYGEKCQLLQDINDLCKDFKKPLKKFKNTKKNYQEKGCATRTNATKVKCYRFFLIFRLGSMQYIVPLYYNFLTFCR